MDSETHSFYKIHNLHHKIKVIFMITEILFAIANQNITIPFLPV